jgi:hypothetical protein
MYVSELSAFQELKAVQQIIMLYSVTNLAQLQCSSQTTDGFNLTGNLNGTQIREIPMNWLDEGTLATAHSLTVSNIKLLL